jgi:hypothetical protein
MESGLTYLAVAYGGFFVLLAAYLMRIVKRNEQLQQDVESLSGDSGDGQV